MYETAYKRVQQRRRYLLMMALLALLIGMLLVLFRYLTAAPTLINAARPENYSSQFSIYGFGADRLSKPSEVALDSKGNIYVADTDKHRIDVFNSTGQFVKSFGKKGKGVKEILFPSGVATAPNGDVYVLSRELNKVVVYNSKYVPYWEIQVESPLTATVKNNKFYLATYRGIMVGDLKGHLLTKFGRWGRKPGDVDHPTGIAVDDKGNIYVADSLNYRIQGFSPTGKSLWTVGSAPPAGAVLKDATRRFGLPVGLTIDTYNTLYLVDAFNGTVILFDTKGKELKRVGEWGHDEGQFYYPGGIAYAGNETFVVADKFNDRVQVITIPSPVAPAYVGALRTPWPYFLPLALLPLLLRFRRRFFADEAFLGRVIEEGELPALADAIPRLFVSPATYEAFKGFERDGIRLDVLLRPFEASSRRAQAVQDKYELAPESVAILAGALRFRRSVVMTEDDELLKALENKRSSFNFKSFISMYRGGNLTPVAEETPGLG